MQKISFTGIESMHSLVKKLSRKHKNASSCHERMLRTLNDQLAMSEPNMVMYSKKHLKQKEE